MDRVDWEKAKYEAICTLGEEFDLTYEQAEYRWENEIDKYEREDRIFAELGEEDYGLSNRY